MGARNACLALVGLVSCSNARAMSLVWSKKKKQFHSQLDYIHNVYSILQYHRDTRHIYFSHNSFTLLT